MIRYRVNVSFKAEKTNATHYFSVSDISFNHFSEQSTVESVTLEITNWLRQYFPDLVVDHFSIYAR